MAGYIVAPTSRSNMMRSTRSPGCGCPSTGTDCGGWRRVGDTPAARRAAESGSLQRWAFAPLVVSAAGVPHADSLRFLELLATQMVQAIGAQRAGVDVDSAGAVMGANTPQMRGAALGRLKAELSLVAMKAGCLHAFEALRCGGGAAVPPASAAALPGVGAVLAPPSSVAFAAPVVQAVAVSAGGGSCAGVLGGAG